MQPLTSISLSFANKRIIAKSWVKCVPPLATGIEREFRFAKGSAFEVGLL
jgi:hypothetical protein